MLISRINSDISLLEFEQSVTTLLRDVENRYWDLYLYLQLYESEIETFRDLVRFHDELSRRDEPGDAVAQAENRIYEGDARIKGSLGDVLKAEYRLRRLAGVATQRRHVHYARRCAVRCQTGTGLGIQSAGITFESS